MDAATSTPRTRARALILAAALALVASAAAPVAPAHAINGVIVGQVTSSVGGAPLPGLTVALYSGEGASPALTATAETDVNGFYSFSSLTYGAYRVEVRGFAATPRHATEFWDGTYSLQTSSTFPVASATPVQIDVALDPAATITGSLGGEFGVPDNAQVVLFHYIGGAYQFNFTSATPAANGSWQASGLAPGQWAITYSDPLPSDTHYRTQYHNQILDQDDQVFVTITAGATVAVTATMSEAGPIPASRLAGPDRYATAIAVSSEFAPFFGAEGTYVYIASGANYPDALSAAPAAAHRGAPLLLTPPTRLPASVAAEIARLEPERIIVAGGPGAVSAAVVTALRGLVDDPAKVVRLGGANRYETSRLLIDDAFGTAATAFVATGRNFPDALAAGAAAAAVGGPVILVNGLASLADGDTRALIDELDVETLYVAGGVGVVSAALAADLATIPGVVAVERLGGADRYETSLEINRAVFSTATTAYLATGTGFADALAGAALAGTQSAPLYTVRRTCIPDDVHTHFRTIEVDALTLLGGTGVLTAAVANRARC